MSDAPQRPEFRVTYDARLVEEAVLLAEAGLVAAERAAFRAERDRAYETPEGEEREARFEELHGRWFVRLGLDRALHQALGERPGLLRGAGSCRVRPARSRSEELADVVIGPERTAPAIVLALRPETLREARLAALLRHELGHVEDMLEPAFGYRRDLPPDVYGPGRLEVVRERYRAVWDATIDGRLHRRGRLDPAERKARRAEFVRAFPALGVRAEESFAFWFDLPRPTHAAILAFALDPAARSSRNARLA